MMMITSIRSGRKTLGVGGAGGKAARGWWREEARAAFHDNVSACISCLSAEESDNMFLANLRFGSEPFCDFRLV